MHSLSKPLVLLALVLSGHALAQERVGVGADFYMDRSRLGAEQWINELRRLGLTVQNRASRAEAERVHVAFMISASSDTQIAEVTDAVSRLARVDQRLCLGVMD